MKFKIDQIALNPRDPARAIALLTKMGASEWALDHVKAEGFVFEEMEVKNEADLAFNYDLLENARELEVLHYTTGDNWMQYHPRSVSHLGMHCSDHELEEWVQFFKAEGISIAQEVTTKEHTNPLIAGKRWYRYVIFATRPILGVDVKFIVRNWI